MTILFLFLCGVFLGSFLGVLIDRLPKDEPVFLDRSRCDFCHKDLAWYMLVPVLSFVFFRGSSACCHKRLSPFYPFIEVLTGFLLIGCYLTSSSLSQLIYVGIIACLLLVIFFTDLYEGIIPLVLILLAFGVTLGYTVLFTSSILAAFLGMILGGGLFLSLFFATKQKGIGFGDVLYAIFMGLFLGYPLVLVGLYSAFLTGAVVSLILIIAGKKKFKGGSIAFGPFLIVGTIIAYLYGESIITFFYKTFL